MTERHDAARHGDWSDMEGQADRVQEGRILLVLNRKKGQAVQCGEVRVTVLEIGAGAGHIRLGFEGPREVQILRGELTTGEKTMTTTADQPTPTNEIPSATRIEYIGDVSAAVEDAVKRTAWVKPPHDPRPNKLILDNDAATITCSRDQDGRWWQHVLVSDGQYAVCFSEPDAKVGAVQFAIDRLEQTIAALRAYLATEPDTHDRPQNDLGYEVTP